MPGVIATIPKFQFSANGVPMVGGTLEVYVAGTTTPTNTWQDSALSIANTNPITLDARGECVLWLDSAVVYKFVLKNAPTNGGVVQWTQDNIKTAADVANTLRTDLAASSGASLVGYMPAGTGAVATTVQTALRQWVTPERFGAVGDGVANDTAALTAWAAVGGDLHGGINKTYLITAEIPLVSNTSIDLRGSTIKATTRFRSYFYVGANVTNVRIKKAIFDMGQPVLATYVQGDYDAAVNVASAYNSGIYAYQSSDIDVQECVFKNLYTNAILMYQCSGFVKVLNNKFLSPVQTQKIKAEHLFFQTCGVDLLIQNNLFDNVAPASADFGVPAIFTSGMTGTLDVSNNTMKYSGRNGVGGHQLAVYSSYGDVAQGDIHHNRMLNCLQQVIRLTICHHMNVHHNYCTMASIAGITDQMVSIEGTTTLGVAPFGCDDIKLHHNTFIDATDTTRVGVFASSYDWGYPLKDIQIHNNLFLNIAKPLSLSAGLERVTFKDNHCTGPNGNIISYLYTTVVPAAVYGTQADSRIKDLVISGNLLNGTGTTVTQPININFVGYTGTIETIAIDDNVIQNVSALATPAVLYRGVAGQGRIMLQGNKVTQYANVFDMTNGSTLNLENNKGRTISGVPSSTSGFTTTVQLGNQYSYGVLNGTARLVNGTVTVSTTEVLTGDQILLTRVASDGSALGHLSLGTITNKTSFVINSSSATDTTFIYWEIRH